MADLWHALHKSDLSYLKFVAEKWDLPFSAPDARQGVDQLTESLLDSGVLLKVDELLTQEEKDALIWLDHQGGKADWDQFTRHYGEIRQMGAGRLDREKPHLNPISPGESLWYRALIARGFFETENGPQEFAYLPDDIRGGIMPLLNPERIYQKGAEFICRVAAPRERQSISPAFHLSLDHICTLLAGIRMDLDPRIHLPEVSDHQRVFYLSLAHSTGLLAAEDEVSTEEVRQFFELSRSEGLGFLWKSWQTSYTPGELYQVPGFQVEGELSLDHQKIRGNILSYLRSLTPGNWWSLVSFISQIKERDPDFLRSGGEYKSWFIKRSESDEFLSGFKHWDEIEGELLRFIITGPLHWLGLIDLGAPEEGGDPLAFRMTEFFEEFIDGQLPSLDSKDPDPVQIRSQGEIRMTPAVPQKVRYQIARFCDWAPYKADAYHYRISPESLARAEKQGLRVAHLLSLLENHTEVIPPNILAALQRWESKGTQTEIGHKLILRVGSPDVLVSLKETRAQRYIIEQLGPTAVVLRPGSQEKVSQALIELGFFSKFEDQSGTQT
jgi:hypothetical protein